MSLKILYFGSFDKPYDTEVYIADTLTAMGHDVARRHTTKTNRAKFAALMSKKWDCVLFSKGWFPNQEAAMEEIERYPGLTIGWFWDLCWGTPREPLVVDHHLFKADIVLTSDGGNKAPWKKYGITHKTLRQGIYEPEAKLGTPQDQYACDVAFVGSLVHETAFNWKHRSDLFQFLRKNYSTTFKHFGTGKAEVRNMELNDLYASAKVVVGDSVYSSNYWSNRLYETTGRGGFLIFPQIDGLEKEFEYYKHIVPYDYYDFVGLKEKIDYYVSHDAEREKIKLAGFEHCKKNHTYTIRCQQLVDLIKEQL